MPYGSEFVARLRELGLVEGLQLRIERRYGDDSAAGLARAAAELVALPVDVIVTFVTPASHAARDATSRIPIVLAGAADPVATGLVARLARPGGNITGVTSQAPDVARKGLEVLCEWRPETRRIGLLLNPTDPFAPKLQAMLSGSAAALGLETRPVFVTDQETVGDAVATWGRQRIDAVFVQPTVGFAPAASAASKHRLPSFSFARHYADLGGLFAYGPDFGMIRRTEVIV